MLTERVKFHFFKHGVSIILLLLLLQEHNVKLQSIFHCPTHIINLVISGCLQHSSATACPCLKTCLTFGLVAVPMHLGQMHTEVRPATAGDFSQCSPSDSAGIYTISPEGTNTYNLEPGTPIVWGLHRSLLQPH